MDKNPVLPFQRHNVGNSAKRDEVEPRAQIEARQRTRFQQSVTKLENDSDAAEITKFAIGAGLWINEGDTLRQLRFGLMMIEHDHIRPQRAKVGDFGGGRSAAIDRDKKRWLVRPPAAFDTFRAEPVALLHARRQKKRGLRSVGAEHFAEESERGDAIDIVIAVKHD